MTRSAVADGPYREGERRPSGLARLAEEGASKRAATMSAGAAAVRARERRRIVAALGLPDSRSKPSHLLSWAVVVGSGWVFYKLDWPVWVLLVFGPIWLAVYVARLVVHEAGEPRPDPIEFEKALSWPSTLPFSLTGYEGWLAVDDGVVEVRLTGHVDEQLLRDAVAAIDPAARVTVEARQTFTVRLSNKHVFDAENEPVHTGDPELLRALVERVLLVLHHEVGVARVVLHPGPLPPRFGPALDAG